MILISLLHPCLEVEMPQIPSLPLWPGGEPRLPVALKPPVPIATHWASGCCLIWLLSVVAVLVLPCIQSYLFKKKFFFSVLVSGSGWLAGTTCPSACFVLLFQQPVSQVFHTVIRGIFKKLGVVGCSVPTGTWPPLWGPEPGLCLVVLPTRGFLEPCIWQWSSRTCEVSPWLGGGPSSRGHTGFRQVVCEVACVS